ncbi:DUF3405 domain-containing protein [Aspergillus homomorphus CBS 101889]|uniref:Major facilitator superfamily transporter n=1 Tax=Aspergillus homomorphus (strain CBS 101889) TaxID=1450537 RepID=A0A395HR46_ASPHC|nr:hypothetical protein BO97DRAFT_406924 [Aspergillus homomorphus CBS 101889]RAL10431.1 hypothetical protein BO97DRAFT_406924 [Aspergillus homomorphus CBS 101889]
MPIRAKRHPASHARFSKKSRNVVVDIEKQPARPQHHYRQYSQSSFDTDNEDSEDDSNSSSSAASHRPMLNDAPVRRPPRIAMGYRVPHRVMRWLCMGLLSFLVVFIIVLFRFTFLSSVSRVNAPLPKPSSKPPTWESFPFLERYHGGIRTLVTRAANVPEYPNDSLEAMGLGSTAPKNITNTSKRDQTVPFSSLAFNPYPDYASPEYIAKYGEKRECFLDEDGTLRIPLVHYYPGVPRGFPDAVIGSNEVLGIKDDVCFDRFGRLGPYGMGYSVRKGGIGAGLEGDREGAEHVWEDFPPIDFRKVDWAAAQNRCMATNSHRFQELPTPRLNRFVSMSVGVPALDDATLSSSPDQGQTGSPEKEHLPRTAFVLRTWHDYRYSPDDILYLRSLISELSLQSGGEYTIHFLVHVKDENLQIWADDETYERVLAEALPAEFRGMATLWSERQMALMYPGLEETWASGLSVHGVYRSTHMPMQYFAYQHPEYDYYWNWEMDARYTGHWYHLFDKVVSWAREQPRKGLWERNARFYVPSVQGTWEDFRQMVRVQTEIGTNSPNNMWSAPKPGQNKSAAEKNALHQQGDQSVWGPERPAEQDVLEVEGEGIPPTTMEKDRYEWGVGEEADLIVLNPLFDPEGTTWALRDDVTGYDKLSMPPRRTAIITASRMSHKLLHTMHKETVLKRHTMFSEMWPASTALHHGFKAVSVPHSIYLDRRWPTKYLESVFNAGRNGASGGARTSVFGDREHNFRGTTWFYSAGFSPNLWRRWLGFKVDNDGGEQEELAGEGRMCLPPMLLHPIKDVEMIIDDGEQARD